MHAAPLCCCRVLVVEDEPDAHEAMARLVRRLGGEVVSATTATEALAGILLKRPDRVLLDLMLPGVGGVEVLRQIRAHGLPVAVAVTTAAHDPLGSGDLRTLHPDAVFRKPLDLAAITQWLLGAADGRDRCQSGGGDGSAPPTAAKDC